MINVAIIKGGNSSERAISLETAKQMADVLDKDKYRIFQYDPATDLAKIIGDAESIDVALLALHGGKGEDGVMQGFLEMIGVPYTGSGIYGSRVAMNKEQAKEIFRRSELLTPKSIMLQKGSGKLDPDLVNAFVGYPLVIKPNSDGSSINTKKVIDERSLWEAWELFGDGEAVIIEEFISGVEVTVSVMDCYGDIPKALCPIEIVPKKGEFFDYNSKYEDDGSEYFIPARLAPAQIERLKDLAIKCHKTLDCRGYSRVDFIIRGNDYFVLEVNTLPGMTEHSLFPKALEYEGYSNKNFLDTLITQAMGKKMDFKNDENVNIKDRMEFRDSTVD